jgi:hypothetical protein
MYFIAMGLTKSYKSYTVSTMSQKLPIIQKSNSKLKKTAAAVFLSRLTARIIMPTR